MRRDKLTVCLAVVGCGLATAALTAKAEPSFFIDAPGTVFTNGNEVSFVASNVSASVAWRVLNWRGETVAADVVRSSGRVRLKSLPCGTYRLERTDGAAGGHRSFVVASDLSQGACRSAASIYGTDAAFSWCCQRGSFACPWQEGDVPTVAMQLMQIGGFSHVRDRFSWEQTNPEPNRTAFGKYLVNARRLTQAGFDVTTSFADTPKHVIKLTKLPSDLTALYRHCRASAKTFGAAIDCWEFWNEPDIGFAPEPAWDYAAAQKAAYLGFKDGNRKAKVSAGSVCHYTRTGYDETLYANGMGRYCDVYNFHTYIPLVDYTNQQSEVRRFLAARQLDQLPVYITELGTDLEGDAEGADAARGRAHTPEQEMLVAEFFAKSFVFLAQEGVARAYAFIFGSLFERGGRKDWGLVRRDGSVKPAYAAIGAQIAAVGDARILGEVTLSEGMRAFLYGHGDGRQTLAFWTVSDLEAKRRKVAFSGLGERTFTLRGISTRTRLADAFGAQSEVIGGTNGLTLCACRFPQYLTGRLGLTPDRPAHRVACGRPNVAEPDFDERIIVRLDFDEHDFKVTDRKCRLEPQGTVGRARVHVWNLSPHKKRGSLSVEGGTVRGLPESIDVPPMGETAFDVTYLVPTSSATAYDLTVDGQFDGRRISRWQAPVRLWNKFLATCVRQPLRTADPTRWQRNDNAKGFSSGTEDGGVFFEWTWPSGDGDKWAYPVYVLDDTERKFVSDSDTLEFEVRSEQDKIENDFACQFVQVVFVNGKSRLMPYEAPNGNWELRRLDLREARYDDGAIAAFRFGGNPKGGKLKMGFRNVRVLLESQPQTSPHDA